MVGRYRTAIEARLTLDVVSPIVRRRRTVSAEALLVDISVTGAALSVWTDSPIGVPERGKSARLTIAERGGLVRVRNVRPVGDRLEIGVEFVELSEGLEELVYGLVESSREPEGTLTSAWLRSP